MNASYEPLMIVSSVKAIKLVLNDKATVLDESPYEFRSSNHNIKIPYVILLKKQVKRNGNVRGPRFSRRGVLVRDNFTCAYCGNPGNTIDHVLPRALGGLSTFENCVTACVSCNHKKSDRTLKQIGWSLPFTPVAPNPYATLLGKARRTDEAYATWVEYIGYYLPASMRADLATAGQ